MADQSDKWVQLAQLRNEGESRFWRQELMGQFISSDPNGPPNPNFPSIGNVTLVVTGSFNQYMHWIDMMGIRQVYQHWQKYFMYADPHNSRGLRDPAFVFWGNYEQRPDWEELYSSLVVYRTFPRFVQNQIRVLVKEPCRNCEGSIVDYENHAEWRENMESEYGTSY